MAKRIRINYIWEPEGWSAESPDLPHWSAAGESLNEVRELTVEAVLIEVGAGFQLIETILPPHVRLEISGVSPTTAVCVVASDRIVEAA